MNNVEKAARAAGYDVRVGGHGEYRRVKHMLPPASWNPSISVCDAIELANDLGLILDFKNRSVDWNDCETVHFEPDGLLATIVNVAAEIYDRQRKGYTVIQDEVQKDGQPFLLCATGVDPHEIIKLLEAGERASLHHHTV